MSNKALVILGIVAVGTVTSAIVLSRVSGKPKTAPDEPAYLIQGLDPDDIASIVVGTGDEAATLQRQGRRFVAASKDNYPAETKEINDLITKCLDIQTSQFVTDNPANHEELEVTEEKARSVVKFFKPDSSLLTGVIVGKYKEAGQGSYIRQAGTDKVYTAAEVPWIRSRALDYVDQNIVSAKREDVNSVTVISPDGQYTLKAEQDGQKAVLENVPEGKKLKESDGNRVLTALTDLRFTDVQKRSAASADLSFDRKYICRLDNSTVYTINIAQKPGASAAEGDEGDDKTYITCQAEFTGERPTTVSKTDSEEQLKEKEAKLLADDNAKQFTAKHQPWIYEIADWKAKDLVKPLTDLLEDKEEEPKETKEDETKPEESTEEQPSEEKPKQPAEKAGSDTQETEP